MRFANKDSITCNLSTWLQWYAFDVIGELTFSKRLGFVDRGEDVEGIIQSIEWMLDYASVVGLSHRLRAFAANMIQGWTDAAS